MTSSFSPTYPSQAFSAETWSRALALNPSVISDILHRRGLHRHVMRFDIQALDSSVRLCGIARTISSRPLVDAPQAGREYELLFAAIDGLRAGEILATDRMDPNIRSLPDSRKGCAGVFLTRIRSSSVSAVLISR